MRGKKKISGALAFLLLLVAIANPAHAQSATYTSNGPALTDAQIDTRLDYLTHRLHDEEISADYWEYGWGAFNGGTMIWNAVQASQDQGYKNHNTDIVNSAESLIGVADVVFRPLPAFNADFVCPQPITTEQERLQCLAAKEELLERSAERAHEPYELLPHLGNIGFNLAAGVVIDGASPIWATLCGRPFPVRSSAKFSFGPLRVARLTILINIKLASARCISIRMTAHAVPLLA